MKHYSISNFNIDYDGIQSECNISKSKIKKVVYGIIYTQFTNDFLNSMEKHNIRVSVYWHYGWNQPVMHVPMFNDYIEVMYELGKYLWGGNYE